MKPFFTSSPVFLLTFTVGLIIAFGLVEPNFDRPTPFAINSKIDENRFDVNLERIEVRDEDKNQWTMNGGYLSMYDAVYFDANNIISIYLEDGFHVSHDGGLSWDRMFRPSGLPDATTGFRVQSLEFLDPQNGWASGSCLISTNDGGKTWRNVKLPEWIDNMKVKFLDRNVGFVAGRGGLCNRGSDCDKWLSVYKTVDGGRTWKRSFRSKDSNTPWNISLVDKNIAMIIADGGSLYRTHDAGRSWKKVLENGHGRAMSLSQAPDGRFWLFGRNSIRISEDFGETWKPGEFDPGLTDHEWWAVDFAENGLGVAVSEDASIAITRDSGKTWKLVTSNLHENGKLPIPKNPFDEALRGITLFGNKGIIRGSQRDYLITIPINENK